MVLSTRRRYLIVKHSTVVFSTAAALLVLGGSVHAQTIPGNENDLQLANGFDVVFTYSNPSIGPPVGTSGVPDFATNDSAPASTPGRASAVRRR
jgi:hypothetical protein